MKYTQDYSIIPFKEIQPSYFERNCNIMMNLATINNQPIEIKEHQGQRVITLKEIDAVHQRPEGTARRNFNTNKEHFIKGEDYYEMSKRELSTNFVRNSKSRGNPDIMVVLITETGYLMLVKSFTDKLAWQIQKELIKSYFRQNFSIASTQLQTQSTPSEIALYHISETVKSILEHQKKSDETVLHIQDQLRFIEEYTGNNITSLGYEMSDIEDQTMEIQTKIGQSESDKADIHKRITTCLNDSRAFEKISKRLILGTDKEREAQSVAILPTDKYKEWVNTQIYRLSKEKHRMTGQIRKDTYDVLTKSCYGYEFLAENGKCDLDKIINYSNPDSRYVYALILIGTKWSEMQKLIGKWR